jgi:hypothetical protein
MSAAPMSVLNPVRRWQRTEKAWPSGQALRSGLFATSTVSQRPPFCCLRRCCDASRPPRGPPRAWGSRFSITSGCAQSCLLTLAMLDSLRIWNGKPDSATDKADVVEISRGLQTPHTLALGSAMLQAWAVEPAVIAVVIFGRAKSGWNLHSARQSARRGSAHGGHREQTARGVV